MVRKKTNEVKEVEKSIAELLWDQIKDVDLNMFALPKQQAHKHLTPNFKFEEALHVTLSSQAVLPVLEEKIKALRFNSKKLLLSQKSQFVVISVEQ